MTVKTDSEYISINQAADLISAHPNTVRNLISSGKLPAFRIGSKLVRISKKDLEAVLSPYEGGEFGQWSKIL